MISQQKRGERLAQDLERIKLNNAKDREIEHHLRKLMCASECKKRPKRKIIPWGLFCPECDSRLVRIKHHDSNYTYALEKYHHHQCPSCTYEFVEHSEVNPCL